MMKLFKINRYFFSSLAFILYLIIINRASYFSSLLFLILMSFFCGIYEIKSNKTFNIFFCISLCYLILGLLNGNKFINIFLDFICFTPIILLVANDKRFFNHFIDNDLAGLIKLLPFLLIASLGIFMYMGYNWIASTELRFDYDKESKLLLFAPITPIFMVPFMLCYSDVKYNKFFLYIGSLFIVYIGFITQTKTVFFPIILTFILKFVIGKSVSNKIKLVLMFILFSWILYTFLIKYVPDTFNSIVTKFDVNDNSNSDRINESLDYLKDCNATQLFFGKGFGGIKTINGIEYIGGKEMIHIGIIHLVLKGGILLLGLIYIPLLLIIFKDYNNKKYQYVLMAIIFIVIDLSHNQWQSLTSILVYWLLVYYRFYKKNNYE